jgi:hypothetical protein
MVKAHACALTVAAFFLNVSVQAALTPRQILSARQCEDYTVQDGDTCSSIASGAGVNIMDLFQANPSLQDEGCYYLEAGQVGDICNFSVHNANFFPSFRRSVSRQLAIHLVATHTVVYLTQLVAMTHA